MTKPGTALHETSLSLPSTLAPRLAAQQSRPPPTATVGGGQNKKYHLGAAEVAEMRRLRETDPKTWTLNRLAEKFGCSWFFARLVAKNDQAGREHSEQLEQVKAKWGRGRRLARMDRDKRKALWGRDA